MTCLRDNTEQKSVTLLACLLMVLVIKKCKGEGEGVKSG